MDFGTLRTLARTIGDDVLGVPIIVSETSPPGDPFQARGVWYRNLEESAAFGSHCARVGARRAMAIAIDDYVQRLGRGARIIAAEQGQAERVWVVEGVERLDSDRILVVLTPVLEQR